MESDIVGHWAGVAQLEERLICNHHLCIPFEVGIYAELSVQPVAQ